MAQYKYSTHLHKGDSTAYDQIHEPGEKTENAGIWRCVGCGHEIGIAKGHTLPPQNHHQHKPEQGAIRWQLLVFAQPR